MSEAERDPKKAVVSEEELRRQVALLSQKGEHAAAAAALWVAGHAGEAAAIYERLFEDARAIRAYEDADDVVGALRVALRAGDVEAIDRVVTRAVHSGRADPLLSMLEREQRHAEVARVHLARGDLERAAASYMEAGRFFDAALCLERMGDLRGAGLAYERHLEHDAAHPEACLRLGRILARFSRHDDAITLLQRAVRHAHDPEEMRCQASPTLILSFTSLGYDGAAEEVWRRWRAAAEHKGLASPASLDEFLRSDSAAAFAAVVSESKLLATAAGGAPAGGGLEAFFHDASEDVEASPASSGEVRAAGMLLAGRYLLGEPLGGGGVGQVFRAYDAFSDRPVAVKIFGSQAMQSDAVQAYARDARAAAALEHPAVTALVELNMPQGYVVTELALGQSVEQRLREGGSAAWLRPFAFTILDLLAECHRTGLVHGALKPTNVFFVPGGVRVVDFGAHHLLALRSTETGGLSSVWPYLSPEQLFGASADARADLYALAAMLYRALTGRPPFVRAEDDRRRAPPPPSRSRPELTGAWDAFLSRALAPDPEERFLDAREMREAMPPLPEGFELEKASSLAGESPASAVLERADRYAKGALVFRERAGTRVYEGRDLTVGRPVWIIEVDDEASLRALLACARISRGAQPVYDVLPESSRAVVARDPLGRAADFTELRAVPQHLTRDLAAVAHALARLHDEGFALGGFPAERGRGPFGPRVRLAPASLPVEKSDDREAEDWKSFVALVDEAFGMDPSLHTDPRRRLLLSLERARFLSKDDVDALSRGAAGEEAWSVFLDDVTERLIAGAPGRVMARLAASVLRG